MQQPSISIALCTHNGAAFIADLMASIITQTVQPFELIVSDDASTDSTLDIVEHYKTLASFTTIVNKNKKKLGVTQNFAKAISLCSGDIIAFCDQDDVWLPEKLNIMLSSFNTTPFPIAVFSDAHVVDATLKSVGYTIWEHVGFNESLQQKMVMDDQPWEVFYQKSVATGATLAFKKSMVSLILPIPDVWLHDGWIAQICASQGRVNCIDTPLIHYRQHPLNVVGGLKQTFMGKFFKMLRTDRITYLMREIARYEALKDRLLQLMPSDRQATMLNMANEKLSFLKCRLALPAQRLFRIIPIYQMWHHHLYQRYCPDWKHAVADFLMT